VVVATRSALRSRLGAPLSGGVAQGVTWARELWGYLVEAAAFYRVGLYSVCSDPIAAATAVGRILWMPVSGYLIVMR
jgi:hypothetical protein